MRRSELELDFFPVDERSEVIWRRDQRPQFAICDVNPPKLLFVVREIGTMDGMRNAAFALQNFVASENRV